MAHRLVLLLGTGLALSIGVATVDAQAKDDHGGKSGPHGGNGGRPGGPNNAERQLSGRANIREGRADIRQGRADVSDGRANIRGGRADQEVGLANMREGRTDMRDALTNIREGRADQEAGLRNIREGRADVSDSLGDIREGRVDVSDGLRELHKRDPREGEKDIREGQRDIREGRDEVSEGQRDIREGRTQVTEGQHDVREGRGEVTEGQRDIREGRVEVSEGLADIREGLAQLAEGRTDIREGHALFAEGRTDIREGRAQFAEGLRDVEQGGAQVSAGQTNIAEGRADVRDGTADGGGGGTGGNGGSTSNPSGPHESDNNQSTGTARANLLDPNRLRECERRDDDPQRLGREKALCVGVLLIQKQAADATLAVRHLGVAMADEDTPAKIEALDRISSFNRSLGATVPLLLEAQLRARPETTRQAEAAFQAVGDYASYVLKVVGPYASSREPEVAQSAATALGELGAYGGGALPTLDALIEPDVRETTAGVAYSAADGITKIDTAVTHLDEQRIAVTGVQPVGQQPSYTVQQLEEQKSFRRRAADRLAGLRSEGERSAAQAQRQLETGPSPVRYDAARELAESGRLLAQVTAALADAERHPVTSTLLHRVSAQGGPANGRQLLPEAALARELPELVAEEGQAPAIALRDSLQAVRQAEQRLAEIAREARGEPDVLERVVTSRNALERRRRETAAPLLAALDRVPVSTRPIVVEALGDTVKSEPVVAALRAAAENGATTSERGAALLALGRLQADGATDQMVAVMADERTDPVLRYQSARALQMLDGRADPATVVPALEAQLSARDPGLRYNAARALVAIKPDSVSPEAFDGLFGDPRIEAEIDRLVAEVAGGGAARATALSRLGQIGPPAVSAVPALVSRLNHGAASDREAVADTIVEISRAALEDLSSTARLLSASGANQERVVAGLGATVQGVEKAIASLTAALQRPADRTVEVAAATALGELDGLASRLTTSLLETAAGDGTGVMNAQAADGLVRSYLAAATPPTPGTVVAAGD